ncbi:nitrite reductase (NAD(P)H) small subunit [Paenibacillus glycanilyticus]|uniref:nitrite reductase (NAD(P)H) small subunit n=1 Tax=Paenibacillus glycanilyticus TaxID=126569 RepID=UPI003EBDC6EF
MTDSMEQIIPIGKEADFPAGYGREVKAGKWSLAVFRTTDGRLFALENHTPHAKGGTLSEAIVSGHYIYCPMRDLKISLETGVVQAPDTGSARKFEVRTGSDVVAVVLPRP